MNGVRYGTGAPGLERAAVCFRDRAFSPHRHDTYGVGITVAGVQAFDYRGATHRARPGDVFVLHPDERHDGRPGTAGGFAYRILYVAPDLVARSLGRLPFVPRAVSRDAGLTAAIDDALAAFDVPLDPLRTVEIVSGLAAALDRASDAPGGRPAADLGAMERVRRHLAAVGRDVGIETLERVAGMDRWSLYRQFRATFGVSPHRYLTLRRLDRARARIAAGDGLAEAAAAAGFADQSHMTRQFRAAYGMPPGRWRALLAS